MDVNINKTISRSKFLFTISLVSSLKKIGTDTIFCYAKNNQKWMSVPLNAKPLLSLNRSKQWLIVLLSFTSTPDDASLIFFPNLTPLAI